MRTIVLLIFLLINCECQLPCKVSNLTELLSSGTKCVENNVLEELCFIDTTTTSSTMTTSTITESTTTESAPTTTLTTDEDYTSSTTISDTSSITTETLSTVDPTYSDSSASIMSSITETMSTSQYPSTFTVNLESSTFQTTHDPIDSTLSEENMWSTLEENSTEITSTIEASEIPTTMESTIVTEETIIDDLIHSTAESTTILEEEPSKPNYQSSTESTIDLTRSTETKFMETSTIVSTTDEFADKTTTSREYSTSTSDPVTSTIISTRKKLATQSTRFPTLSELEMRSSNRQTSTINSETTQFTTTEGIGSTSVKSTKMTTTVPNPIITISAKEMVSSTEGSKESTMISIEEITSRENEEATVTTNAKEQVMRTTEHEETESARIEVTKLEEASSTMKEEWIKEPTTITTEQLATESSREEVTETRLLGEASSTIKEEWVQEPTSKTTEQLATESRRVEVTETRKSTELMDFEQRETTESETTTSAEVAPSHQYSYRKEVNCSRRCDDDDFIGDGVCLKTAKPSSLPHGSNYQAAMSYCRAISPRADVINLAQLRNRQNIDVLQKAAVRRNMSLFYASGGGSAKERHEKTVDVFDIFAITLMSSPTKGTIRISEESANTSVICIRPEYCDASTCDIQSTLNVFNLHSIFKTSSPTIIAGESAQLTCSFTQESHKVSCSPRGHIQPHPSLLECTPSHRSQAIGVNDQGQPVSSCKSCFARGTARCEERENGTFECICHKEYAMKTCWLSVDVCAEQECVHGKCINEEGVPYCECFWGYTGDLCNSTKGVNRELSLFQRLRATFSGSNIAAFQVTVVSIFALAVKMITKVILSSESDDPQTNHQELRAVFLIFGSTCILLFHNPGLFNLSEATCRMHFLLIHFTYIAGLYQWVFEAFNVNQVLRFIHPNRWCRGYNNERIYTGMAKPRFVISLSILSIIMLTIYHGGWHQLVSEWTCVGVFHATTSSMWFPLMMLVACGLLATIAIYESSERIRAHRPLLSKLVTEKLENDFGFNKGQNIEKCRRNVRISCIGAILYTITWLMAIVSSDRSNDKLVTLFNIFVASCYALFAGLHEIYVSAGLYPLAKKWLMKKLPEKLAMDYEETTMWTRQELLTLEPTQIPENAKRYARYKWQKLLQKKLSERKIQDLEEAIKQILREEVNRMHKKRATKEQKEQILATFAHWALHDAPNYETINPREEMVNLCCENPDGTTSVQTFFILPNFGVFKPIIPQNGESFQQVEIEYNERMKKIKENYEISRKEFEAQSNFIRSAIHFRHFGKITD